MHKDLISEKQSHKLDYMNSYTVVVEPLFEKLKC